MKVNNYSFSNLNELLLNLDLKDIIPERTLIQVFSGLITDDEISFLISMLRKKNDQVTFIGTTTAGEIINGEVDKESIAISVIEFDETIVSHAFFTNEDDFKLGVDIASLFKNNTRAAILFIDGLSTNGNDVVDGIASVNKKVPIAGGMAGDNGYFKETHVFNHDGIYKKGAVVVSLESEKLNVFTDYQLNWLPIGQYLTVTKAEKNHLYELDNQPVSDVYRTYLGNMVGNALPHSAIEFPLIKIDENGFEVCRTFVHLFDDGSLLTIGNLEVGDKVRFAIGNVALIVNNSKQQAAKYYQDYKPEALLTYSCASRITFLQSEVVTELKPLNKIAPIAGFFTYGEIFHRKGKNALLNISLTILGLSESEIQPEQTIDLLSETDTAKNNTTENNFFKDKHFLVLDALTHLSNTVIDKLNSSEEKTRLLLTSIGEGVFGVGSDGLVNFINPAALEMLQYSEHEIIGQKIHAIIHHSHSDGSQYKIDDCPMYHALINGKVSHIEDEILWKKDGSFFPVEYHARPIYKNDEITGSVVTFNDITKRKDAQDLLEKQQHELHEIHKQTRDSIEYAALIQSALIPDNTVFHSYFKGYFSIWHPKDIVGGDIYLVEELSENEIVIMVIDCTGHGVPGAFVTMLVKAVERQIINNLHKDKIISPAKMLGIFNKSIKHLLKQENIDSISNAGFDGGILYYNKKEKIARFSGAETPLFIIQNDEVKIIKGNRHSIGYKKSQADYEFTDHVIDISQPTQLYLTTDGYLDQNGGEKSFPFGKKRFSKLILENANESFADQQEMLLYELQNYQKDNERNDDVTVIGLKF